MKEFYFKQDFRLFYRPNTTDEKVIEEVLRRNVYERKKIGFAVEKDDMWLDLGANIGTFSLLCLSKGAPVIAFEPEPENFAILERNIRSNSFSTKRELFQEAVSLNTGVRPFYLCKGDYNKYRHTLYPKRGRPSIDVKTTSIRSILRKYPITCIKMDIEGSEIDLLEGMQPFHFKSIRKLVFEYSFDVDKSIPRFLAIIERLKKSFSMIHYDKVKPNELEYRYFPACTLVFCKK